MKFTATITALIALVLFGLASQDLAPIGASVNAPNQHVSDRYVAKSYEETGAPNFVTAVLADYRGYDTLGETVVIFTAGMACLLILGWRRKS